MTKQHLHFTSKLIRLSKQKVGLREATLLFACTDGETVNKLAAAIAEHRDTVKGRLGVLRKKSLVEITGYDRDGHAIYKPTAKGNSIIANVAP
jgi:DNA-binding MarR family transcriptional regulator